MVTIEVQPAPNFDTYFRTAALPEVIPTFEEAPSPSLVSSDTGKGNTLLFFVLGTIIVVGVAVVLIKLANENKEKNYATRFNQISPLH